MREFIYQTIQRTRVSIERTWRTDWDQRDSRKGGDLLVDPRGHDWRALQ